MLSSRSKDGKKIVDRGNPVLSQDAVKLLKTQDSGYLRTMIQKTRRALERLEQEFVLREGDEAEVLGQKDGQGEGQHIVFADNREEQKQYTPGQGVDARSRREEPGQNSLVEGEVEDENADASELPSVPSNQRSRRMMEKEAAALKDEKLLRKQHRKEQDARRSKLAALKAREKDLVDAENELELQRAKMSNTVGGTTKAGVKWKVRERKT